MPKAEAPDWDGVRELSSRIESGKPLALSPKVISILRQAARDVAIRDEVAEKAMQTAESATALLRKIEERIHRGSRRLMPALSRMYKLRDAGDLQGARQELREALAVLVVPHHRRIAQGQLNQLEKGTRTKATKSRKVKARPPSRTGKAPPRRTPRRK